MELSIAAAQLFPNENVSPTFESYAAMSAKWRGSQPCPPEQSFIDAWTEWDKNNVEAKRKAEGQKQGLTDSEKLDALWKAHTKQDTAKLDELTAKEAAIEVAIPDKP